MILCLILLSEIKDVILIYLLYRKHMFPSWPKRILFTLCGLENLISLMVMVNFSHDKLRQSSKPLIYADNFSRPLEKITLICKVYLWKMHTPHISEISVANNFFSTNIRMKKTEMDISLYGNLIFNYCINLF